MNRLARVVLGVAAAAGLLSGLALSAPASKVLLRYHPRPGTVTHFRTYSHYYLGGQLKSGPRPEYSLTMFGMDSVVAAGADSVVRRIEIDSMSRTTADESTGVARTLVLMEGTWTDRRVPRGEIRGVSSIGVLDHMVPDVLDGVTALPDDSMAVGDSWKAEGKYQVVEVQDTLGHLQARIQAKLKSLSVQGTDTVALFHLKVKLDGPEWFYKEMQQTQQLSGTVEGDELFSLSRGVTDSLALSGTLTTEFDLGGAGRAGTPTKVSLIRVLTVAR